VRLAWSICISFSIEKTSRYCDLTVCGYVLNVNNWLFGLWRESLEFPPIISPLLEKVFLTGETMRSFIVVYLVSFFGSIRDILGTEFIIQLYSWRFKTYYWCAFAL
jgi:hypothetical protein